MFKIFGIRHHGPGSAKSLLKAFETWQPNCILIEGAPDADNLIRYVSNEGLKPPVAILIYNPKNLQQASYYPFAEFSPEWQAMKYALKRSIPVSFMDLPMSLHFSIDTDKIPVNSLFFNENTEGDIPQQIIKDPLNYLAKLAGYTDSERWWEATFEQKEHTEAIFDTILDMMKVLRQELNRVESSETLLREAYMRKILRKAIKDGFQRIAVVCGAWHAPVLEEIHNFKEKADNDLLKGIKKITTESTWVPWSYSRLAVESGYGAGVVSPAWYDLLFSKRSHATIRWMTKAARLLRKEDFSASSAHSIEAVRLAETLAILRGQTIAGLEELQEAALSIFCDGYNAPLTLIREKLVIGNNIGKVPSEIPQVPLQRDLEACVKTARLSKEYASTEGVTKELDLRKETQLLASHLIHRLNLLSIPWGKPMKGSQYRLGTFKETWKLQWKPDFAIRIIDAAQWGNTIEEAATQFVKQKIKDTATLTDLTILLGKTLDADIKAVIPQLVAHLQDLAALTEDVLALMDTLLPLVNVLKYGNVRGTHAESVAHVIEQIVPRITIGLPSVCIHTDEEATQIIFEKLQTTNRAISLLNDAYYTSIWLRTLRQIALMTNVNGILNGISTRILFDKDIFSIHDTATQLRLALSKGNEAIYSASWLEGFLNGSGLLLIHHYTLWQVIDDWVNEIEMERLTELLPILRRTFSKFTASERQKMLSLAKNTANNKAAHNFINENKNVIYDEKRAEAVLKTVQLFL